MISLRFRIHEWMADHFKGVQYPIQRLHGARPAVPSSSNGKHQLSVTAAVLVLAGSLGLVIASLGAAAVLLGFFWAMFFR